MKTKTIYKLEAGDIIQDRHGNEYKVEEVVRSPQSDNNSAIYVWVKWKGIYWKDAFMKFVHHIGGRIVIDSKM